MTKFRLASASLVTFLLVASCLPQMILGSKKGSMEDRGLGGEFTDNTRHGTRALKKRIPKNQERAPKANKAATYSKTPKRQSYPNSETGLVQKGGNRPQDQGLGRKKKHSGYGSSSDHYGGSSSSDHYGSSSDHYGSSSSNYGSSSDNYGHGSDDYGGSGYKSGGGSGSKKNSYGGKGGGGKDGKGGNHYPNKKKPHKKYPDYHYHFLVTPFFFGNLVEFKEHSKVWAFNKPGTANDGDSNQLAGYCAGYTCQGPIVAAVKGEVDKDDRVDRITFSVASSDVFVPAAGDVNTIRVHISCPAPNMQTLTITPATGTACATVTTGDNCDFTAGNHAGGGTLQLAITDASLDLIASGTQNIVAECSPPVHTLYYYYPKQY